MLIDFSRLAAESLAYCWKSSTFDRIGGNYDNKNIIQNTEAHKQTTNSPGSLSMTGEFPSASETPVP
jgi:hypothetical protein